MSELGHDAVWLLDHYLRIWDGHNGRLMPDIHMESLRGVRDELVSLRAELADREDLMEMAQQEMDRLRGMNKRLRAELTETRAADRKVDEA